MNHESNSRLFTPGPLTTSASVRTAMTVDWGSRDKAFAKLTSRVRKSLQTVVNGVESHETVLLQGAGTFAVEATIATLVADKDTFLALVNGEYGRRIVAIAQGLGKTVQILEFNELEPVSPDAVRQYLAEHPEVSKVALVQLETTTGILNPYEEIAEVVHDAGCQLVLDAMSGFAAYSIDVRAMPCAAVIASSNKGLHGAPGIGFAIIERKLLRASKGNCASLSFDLHAQWQGFEKNGQWRFTPPTHCLAAMDQAIAEFIEQGGTAARFASYKANADIVLARMADMGFSCLVPTENRSSVILTFGVPEHAWFDFEDLYTRLSNQGFFLYPGKLTQQPSFRIGCIGALEATDFARMLDAFEIVLREQKAAHQMSSVL